MSLLRLGYYQVGTQVILNKANALLAASKDNLDVQWIFNDDIYAAINWAMPVAESLSSLYRRRAQQLRDKYDHLILYYSGGADSTNVLHAFIDNGIFLDEIIMQYPKPVESYMTDQTTENNNYFSEIKYAAMPHLSKVADKIDPRTRIRILDQSQDTIDIFKNPYWFEKYPLGTMITPAGAGRQISAILDSELDKLYEQGRTVCQIYGVDKPLVQVAADGNYYASFKDANATHAVPTGFELGEIASKYFNLEFFYWTPDMPGIVVKQAQAIKAAATVDPLVKQCLRSDTLADQFRAIIHPIIYCAEATAPVFQTAKPHGNVYRPMDRWFWLPEFKQSQDNYLNVINYLKDNIASKYAIQDNILNGLNPISSRTYLL